MHRKTGRNIASSNETEEIFNNNISKNKMKNFTKFLVAASGLVIASFGANAQQTSTATATASATIITPISITKTQDLNFGNVAVSASAGGTVVMAPAGTRSTTGSVSLPATTGSPAAAQFTVSGQGNYTYSITLPSTSTEIDDNASHTMQVDNFTSNPATTGTLSSGTQTLTVGATLNVGAAQATGTYTSDVPFQVTVNYN
jgi:hypothetical protein